MLRLILSINTFVIAPKILRTFKAISAPVAFLHHSEYTFEFELVGYPFRENARSMNCHKRKTAQVDLVGYPFVENARNWIFAKWKPTKSTWAVFPLWKINFVHLLERNYRPSQLGGFTFVMQKKLLGRMSLWGCGMLRPRKPTPHISKIHLLQ